MTTAAPLSIFYLILLIVFERMILPFFCKDTTMPAIKDWPEDERPREKLLHRGAAALSDAELLALILRSGDASSGTSAIDQGRLLVLSCFGQEARRMTSAQAMIRNDLVAALSSALIIPHASRQGRTLTTVHRALGFGCPVFTFADEANSDLIAAGVEVLRNAQMTDWINSPSGSDES